MRISKHSKPESIDPDKLRSDADIERDLSDQLDAIHNRWVKWLRGVEISSIKPAMKRIKS
jgi:hypothetical protein